MARRVPHREPPSRDPAPTRLARKLGTFDAVVIGLGAMIGAGVFAVPGPAARAAGSGLLVALVIAALVAWCNALSSAQLAALYPESGGAYVYGRRRLGALWGFLAGWGFVVGKLASCAAMALTFASHAAPQWTRPLAVAAVLAMTAVNYFGIQKTAWLTRALVAVVLLSLAIVVVAALSGGQVRAWYAAGGWQRHRKEVEQNPAAEPARGKCFMPLGACSGGPRYRQPCSGKACSSTPSARTSLSTVS